MTMKTAVAVVLACLAPGLSLAASLSGSIVDSAATVNLSGVGTLAWARWPGYVHKGNEISDITTTGWRANYSNDLRLIGDRKGVKIGGTTRLEPHPQGCQRTIEGEVTVNVRLVGGQIERFVAEDVQKSYDRTAPAMAAFIAQRKQAGGTS